LGGTGGGAVRRFAPVGSRSLPGSGRFQREAGAELLGSTGLELYPSSLGFLSWSFLLCGRFSKAKLGQSAREVPGLSSTPATSCFKSCIYLCQRIRLLYHSLTGCTKPGKCRGIHPVRYGSAWKGRPDYVGRRVRQAKLGQSAWKDQSLSSTPAGEGLPVRLLPNK
jgi:hypothetical protein